MKTKLLALALASLSGAVLAQSNVTVYGVADIGWQKTTGSSAKIASSAPGNTGGSRLGFKGSEDLGGGLKAIFNFEQQIDLANGATQANTFARQAWVGVSGGFGELTIGRNYTVGFRSADRYEMTGYANYSDVADAFGGAPGATRNDGQIRYDSPDFNGFRFMVDYVPKPNNGTVGDSETGVSLTYSKGALIASATYADLGNGLSAKAVGGAYKLGFGTVAVSYQDPVGAGKGWTVGIGEVQAGPFWLTLDYSRNSGQNFNSVMFEGKYLLSKRTFAYLAVLDSGKTKTTLTSLGMRHNF
jgi:predicted porin